MNEYHQVVVVTVFVIGVAVTFFPINTCLFAHKRFGLHSSDVARAVEALTTTRAVFASIPSFTFASMVKTGSFALCVALVAIAVSSPTGTWCTGTRNHEQRGFQLPPQISMR